MEQEALARTFRAKLDGVAEGLAAWRVAHPKATLTEIQQAMNRCLEPVRAEIVAEVALASAATDLAKSPRSTRPRCEECGGRLSSLGRRRRTLMDERGERFALERTYAVCTVCGREFFPPR